MVFPEQANVVVPHVGLDLGEAGGDRWALFSSVRRGSKRHIHVYHIGTRNDRNYWRRIARFLARISR